MTRRLLMLLLVPLIVASFASQARAEPVSIHPNAFPVVGWGYSVGYGIGRGAGLNPDGYAWIGWWDPPANILRGRITFAYDPSLITIRPDLSGFVGQFSSNPAVDVPVNPTGVYPAFDVTSFVGPRPGMIWQLSVGLNTVTLDFDLTANPVSLDPDAGHVNIFGLVMETSQQLSGWTIESTSVGQFRELGSPQDQSQTFAICSSGGVEFRCGETSSLGLTAKPTPEPTTMLLLGTGLAGVAIKTRKRLKSRKSQQGSQ